MGYKYGVKLFLLSTIFLKAENIQRQIEDITRYQEQKNIYNMQKEENKVKTSMYTDVQTISLEQDSNASKACLNINNIDTEDITLISKRERNKIVSPYLNRCNTMQDINTLVKEINNIYIKEAYVTSRAYIKPQNMREGYLKISVMEGKIEKVIGNNISTKLIFPFVEGSYLNLRDLEIAIEQLNRLQSVQATMAINPGKKEGYSQIIMKGKTTGTRMHGSLGVNSFGTSKSGKYQLSGSLSIDNPLTINDILKVNLNTTNKQDNQNSSIGNSISYGLPIGRSYLEFSYSKFSYNQIVNGLNIDYESKGESENFQGKLEYKLFHNKTQKGKLDFSLIRKKNDNYLAGVFLDTSSSKLTVFQMGYTHNFMSKSWDSYVLLKYYRGLSWFNAKSGVKTSPTFHKYTMDISYNKKLKGKGVPTQYNFSFHGQYAKEGILGSEQIGMGGPYSVRGFKNEGQISGNKGFYIRNELAFNQKLAKGSLNPYLSLDYGVVARNKQSYGGKILGVAIGARINLYSISIDMFKSIPIYDSNKITFEANGDEVRKINHGFTGFSLSYIF